MGFSRFRAGVALRTAVLFLVPLWRCAQMLARTQWYVPHRPLRCRGDCYRWHC